MSIAQGIVPSPFAPAGSADHRKQPTTTYAVDHVLEARLRQWVTAIAERNERALAELYEATAAQVYGWALRVTAERTTAEEVCADVYWQIWRDARQYDQSRGRVMAWILTITRTRALDAWRKRADLTAHTDPETALENAASQDATPHEAMLANERGHALHRALSCLRPMQRQMLTLAFFRGYTHEEIARHAQLNIGSVKTHIRRGLAALRGNLTALT